MLEEMTYTHSKSLMHSFIMPTMPDERQADKAMIDALVSVGFIIGGAVGCIVSSRTLVVNSRIVTVGDVVLYEVTPGAPPELAEVYFHCRVDGVCYSCIAPFSDASRCDSWVKATVKDTPCLIESARIIQAVIHTHANVGAVTTALTNWPSL